MMQLMIALGAAASAGWVLMFLEWNRRRRIADWFTESASALATAPIGVIVFDRSGRVVWKAGALIESIRITWSSALGMGGDWAKLQAPVMRAVRGLPSDVRWRVGGMVMEATVRPNTAESLYSGAIVLLRDVTVEENVSEDLRDLVESKDRLIASVSHELRTPLTSVMGIAQLLADPDTQLEPGEGGALLAVVAEQSADMADIIEDLLVAARIGSSHFVAVSETIDLAGLVGNVVANHNRRFGYDVPISGPRSYAIGDPLRIRQIVRNLLSNAEKHGGGDIRVRLSADLSGVHVDVLDAGPPIPQELRGSIFEPYRGSEHVGRTDSIGLGLTVSRQLARLMGGDVVYKHDGEQACFRLRLRGAEFESSRAADEVLTRAV